MDYDLMNCLYVLYKMAVIYRVVYSADKFMSNVCSNHMLDHYVRPSKVKTPFHLIGEFYYLYHLLYFSTNSKPFQMQSY